MKKYLIIIMAALFAVACSDKQEEVAPAPAVEQYQFTVSVNQGESSRAFLQDLAKIFWEIHDKITLYAKSYKDSSKKVELEAQEVSDATAKFVGTGDKPAATDVFYATYPEDAQLEVNADGDVASAKFVLPTAQNGVGDSPLMAAKTSEVAASSMSLTFKPIFAALNIVLNEDVDKIIFTANDGSAVSGDYKYDFANGVATVSGTIKNITVVPTDDKRNIVVIVPAMHYAQGFNLEFVNSRGRMLYNYGKAGIDLAIGKYYELGSANSPITFKPIEVTLGTVETTYENWGKSTINSNAIYTTNNTFSGAVSKSLIEEIGVEYTAQSNNVTNTQKLSVVATPFSITPTGLASDIYTVRAYVKLKGLSEKMYSAPKTVGVIDNEVKLSLTTSSSYSTITDSGTSVTKNNNFLLGGDGFNSEATVSGVNKLLVKELALTSSVASSKVADDLSTSITKDGLTYDKWTNYPVTTQLTLKNGAVITHATQTAVVTGIPYFVSFNSASNSKDSYVKTTMGWSVYNYGYYTASNDAITLDANSSDSKRGYAITPKFNIPTTINVSTTVKGYLYYWVTGDKSCYLYVGATNSNSTKSSNTVASESIKSSASLTSNGNTRTFNHTVSDAAQYISVTHNSSSGTFRFTEFGVSYN